MPKKRKPYKVHDRRQCPCGHCYWCFKCKQWVPERYVCGAHQGTIYDRGLTGREDC